MNQRILITGSSGLVGTALTSALSPEGVDVIRFDLRGEGDAWGDVRDPDRLRDAIAGADGIVHLAAVSRVIWGEQDPAGCWATNVEGLKAALTYAARSPRAPWFIFASSREVYGQPERLPVTEDFPLRPVNIYGRSKVEGERLVDEARRAGVRACIIRLSNVFGSVDDHADRVVPAFARAAAFGQPLRVDGADHTFDFTYIDDVVRGIIALIRLLSGGEEVPPPIHFVSGTPTTLGELAQLAIELSESKSEVRLAPPRNFDVARFFGDHGHATARLGWRPQVPLREGLARLIQAFRDAQGSVAPQGGGQ